MSKGYPTELMTRIEPMRQPPLTADTDAFLKEQLAQREKELRSKFSLLLHHYGIEPNDPQMQGKLLWALIYDHIPGFQIRDHETLDKGRPEKTVSEKLQLISDVARLRLDTGKSIISACKELIESGAYKGQSPESLQKRYNEARRMPVAQMFSQLGLTDERPDLWASFADAYTGSREIEEQNTLMSNLPNKTI